MLHLGLQKHKAVTATRQSDSCIHSHEALGWVRSAISQGGLGSFLAESVDQRRPEVAEESCKLICL